MIKQKFLVDFGSKLFIYFITALVGIIVTRVVGPQVVGTVAFGYSYVTTFFFLFGLFGTSHIKLISEGESLKDCLKIYTVITAVSLVVFILSVTGFFLVQKYYLGIPFTEEEEIVILLTVIMIGIEGLFKIPDITFTALIQQVKINIPKLVNSIVFSLGRIAVILLGYKAIALVSARLLGVIAIIPIYLYLMKDDFKLGRWRNDLFKRYLKIGAPLLIITISISVMGNYSMVLLKNMASVSEVGYYTGGLGLASIFVMMGSTAGDLFFPLFSKASSEGNYDYIRNQIGKFEHFLFRFVLPLLVILSINSGTIIPFLLSDKYLPSVPIFSLLVFFSFFKIWTLPFYNLMNGLSKFNLNALTHVIFLVLFFLLLIFFISPNYMNLGGLGLALSFLVLEMMKLITWYFLSNKEVRFKFNYDVLRFVLFFGAFYYGSKLIYDHYISGQNYWIGFAFVLLDTVLIFVFLFLLGLIKRADMTFLAELFNIKSLKDYFKKELTKSD